MSRTTSSAAEVDNWRTRHPYHSEFGDDGNDTSAKDDVKTTVANAETVYQASCYCGRVKYEVKGEPESSKLCHCRGCQLLHGAPFEWVSIFHKRNVKFIPESLDYLYFYSGELDVGFSAAATTNTTTTRPELPLKVSCSHCRTPVADEGRHMWLAFTTLFGFTMEGGIPDAFRHSCHLFYSQRCVDMGDDDKTKWEGHKNKSPQWKKS